VICYPVLPILLVVDQLDQRREVTTAIAFSWLEVTEETSREIRVASLELATCWATALL
jgi:hypothetical protein